MSTPHAPDPADDVSLSWAVSDQLAGVPDSKPNTGGTPAQSGAAASPPGAADADVTDAMLISELVDQIHDVLPGSWSSYLVEIAIADAEHRIRAAAQTPDGRLIPIDLAVTAIQMAATHRLLTGDPVPWMWLRITQDRGGQPQITTFDGFVGAPPEHLLFPAASYLSDASMAPQTPKPLWLLAHIGNRGGQLRSATAAAAAQATPAAGAADAELPPLDLLWSRFAALAAVFAAVDAYHGPRMNAGTGIFRGDLGGCTLSRLPGGRAVLSGGADHSPLMTAAYNSTTAHPDLYRGAPAWVSNIVLDDRVHAGMLSFCYWWSDGHWSRADIAGPDGWSAIDEISPAVPGVWTTEITAELVRTALAAARVVVNVDECIDYVRQVDAGNTRPDLLTRTDQPLPSPAEGLTILDLGQPW
ncbi:hypothetical protein QSJ18_13385 [Gordonia sp. ABSL1-1]|uniref:hypothetical protein n=1 Tax=Gordonia sp. ABSL1-1 TaxID=3053923 RepID=UPI0025747098|nr:hypothetical protein [Gordonia sp. ABSL1-1]MDL9937740.1 hypothetical protein [Gordonia sp. ABSL1-1]